MCRPRLLMIEDDSHRADLVRGWLPAEVQLVVARSAGVAVGVVKRDSGDIYCGILLDHDLDQHAATESDRQMSGMDAVGAIIQHVARTTPVLVHSMNASQAPVMVDRLRRAGFDVTRIPFAELDRQSLLDWLEPLLEELDDD